MRTAALYYLSERDSGRPSWRVPRFSTEQTVPGRQVQLDDDTWSALDIEAARQGVSADTLAVHALMFFLADIDSGRIGGRIELSLEDED